MSSDAKKVILVSQSGYSGEHDSILQSLIDRKIYLFCTLGKDYELWEEIMDELCVGKFGEGTWDIITTSHPDESLNEVSSKTDLL